MEFGKICYERNVYFNDDGSLSKSKTALWKSAVNITNCVTGMWQQYTYHLPYIILSCLKNYNGSEYNEIAGRFKTNLQFDITRQLNDYTSPPYIYCIIRSDCSMRLGVSIELRRCDAEEHANTIIESHSIEELRNQYPNFSDIEDDTLFKDKVWKLEYENKLNDYKLMDYHMVYKK